MMRFTILVLVLVLVLAAGAAAQSFEVATVKLAPRPQGDSYNINLGTTEHGVVTLTNTTLCDSLRFAYQIPSDAQIAGPDWIKNKEFHYVIVGKAAPETPREELLRMLQALLLDRFQMAVHREPRELNYYALTQSKKLKIQPAKESDSRPQNVGRDHITSPHMSMYTLAVLLARFELHGIVLDKTELNGMYGVQLDWSPATDGAVARADSAGPSIFTAVKEQLGLSLEARKGPVEVLVVDRAEKVPTEN